MVTLKDGNPDAVVPGLFAIGEAACVSVHGANRLGSNSLIDLVVFGRATGLRLAEILKGNALQDELPKNSSDLALGRLDKFRHARTDLVDFLDSVGQRSVGPEHGAVRLHHALHVEADFSGRAASFRMAELVEPAER